MAVQVTEDGEVKQFRRWAILGVWLTGLIAAWWITPTQPRVIIPDASLIGFSPDGRMMAIHTLTAIKGEVVAVLMDIETGRRSTAFTFDNHTATDDDWHRDSDGAWQLRIRATLTTVHVPLTPPATTSEFGPLQGEAQQLAFHERRGRVAAVWTDQTARKLLAVHDASTGRMIWSVPHWKSLADGTVENLYHWELEQSWFPPHGKCLIVSARQKIDEGMPPTFSLPNDDLSGWSIYDAETGRHLAKLPEFLWIDSTPDVRSAFLIVQTNACESLVHIDLTTGQHQTVAEYRGRIRDMSQTTAMFYPDWKLPPTAVADGRVLAARVDLGSKST